MKIAIIFLCFVALAAAQQCIYDTEECPCLGRANVAVLVDTTGSIRTSGQYGNLKTFVKKVVGRLGLGDNSIRTAGITFANHPLLQWGFDSPTSWSHQAICNIVDSGFPEVKGQTYTNEAIDMASANLQAIMAKRPFIKCNAVLLVTDGGSDDKALTTASVANIRNKVPGVKFCVVSIRQDDEGPAKKANRDQEIADFVDGNGQNLEAKNFVDLDGLVEGTMQCLCKCAAVPCCPPPPPPCQADVVVIVDRTGSIGQAGKGAFPTLVQFVKDLFDAIYAIEDAKTSLISFSNKPTVHYDLDSSPNDADSAKAAVDLIEKPKGQTYTDLALLEAVDQFSNHGRQIARRVVLITDGGSDDKQATVDAANKLHLIDSMKMCVVSIRETDKPGTEANRDGEIANLVDGCGENIESPTFADLPNLVQQVIDCICSDCPGAE